MVASSNPSIFTGSRDHLDGGKDALKKISKLRSFLNKLFSDSRSAEGAPRWPQARISQFLKVPVRRLESHHIYSVGGLGGASFLDFSALIEVVTGHHKN